MFSLDECSGTRERIVKLLERYPLNLERIPRFEALEEMSEAAVSYEVAEPLTPERAESGMDPLEVSSSLRETAAMPGEEFRTAVEKGRWNARSIEMAFAPPRGSLPREPWDVLLATMLDGDIAVGFPTLTELLDLEHSKVHESLQRMKMEVQLVQLLLLQLGDCDVRFVELRYFQKKSITRVCDELFFSRSTFYRRNEDILSKLTHFYELIFSHYPATRHGESTSEETGR